MGILANIVSKTALAGVEATGHSAEPHPLIRIGLGLLLGPASSVRVGRD